MSNFGHNLSCNGLKAIYFAHGTFVGHDPFGLVDFLKLPRISKRLDKGVRSMLSASTNQILKDTGNFTQAYIELAEKSLNIKARKFSWSSANHHYARVKGLTDLVRQIALDIQANQLNSQDEIMLIGHSHAGQIFSILSRLVNMRDHKEIEKYILDNFDPQSEFKNGLKKIKGLGFKYVTLGTPPRYQWYHNEGELLQLVNHTTKSLSMPGVKGIATIDYGDYIQKIGQQGSDIAATIREERLANKDLDGILGIGKDQKVLRQNLEKSSRPIGAGYTKLIDFQANMPTSYRNSFTSIFGHGIYTRYDKMFLLFSTIAEHFTGQSSSQ